MNFEVFIMNERDRDNLGSHFTARLCAIDSICQTGKEEAFLIISIMFLGGYYYERVATGCFE